MSSVVVVGAGLSGLVAARSLVEAGHEVTVLDKGRSPGGRLATRRIGDAVVDHGAQFFTVRSDPFAAAVAEWTAQSLVVEWCRGFAHGHGVAAGDGFPRYRVAGGMNALAKRVAVGLDVRCNTLAFRVRPDGDHWTIQDDSGHHLRADAVIVTAPVPQALALCIDVREAVPEALWQKGYDPTLALLVVLDGPSGVPDPGGVQEPGEPFSFIADNRLKGLSNVTALTMHAGAEWSRTHWDDDPAEAEAALIEAARPWFANAAVTHSQLKRWRFATPIDPWPEACVVAQAGPPGPLVLAGDAYGGPKIEGAFLSGLAAASAVLG